VGITPGRPIRCRPGPFARPACPGKLGPGRAPGGPSYGARGTRRAGRGPWSGLRGASWRRPWPWLLGPWCLVRRPGGRCLCLCGPGARCLCGRSQTQAGALVRDPLTWDQADQGPGPRSVDLGTVDQVQLLALPGARSQVRGPVSQVRDQVPARPGTRAADQAPVARLHAPCSVSEYPLTPGPKKGPRSGGHGL
jgi:hypothetical protein